MLGRVPISIAALTVRARSLGLITENQSIYVFKQLAILPGGRKSEPLDKETPKETSKLISDMIDFLEAKGRFSKDDIARLVPLPAGRLAEMSAKPESYFFSVDETPNNVISFQLRR